MDIGKQKLTVYLDSEVVRAARARAARRDQRDSQVIEDALRSYLGIEPLDEAQAAGRFSEEGALGIAYEELHGARRKRAGR